jgi:hypothetical protein
MNPDLYVSCKTQTISPLDRKKIDINEIIAEIRKIKNDWLMVQSLNVSDEVKAQIQAELENKITDCKAKMYHEISTILLAII